MPPDLRYANRVMLPYRRAYQRYRERQRQQKDADRQAIAALDDRLRALETERLLLAQRVDLLQKVGDTLSSARLAARCMG